MRERTSEVGGSIELTNAPHGATVKLASRSAEDWTSPGRSRPQRDTECGDADVQGMLAYMQRTTVKLPDDLDARLRHEAARRGITVSDLTREAIETLLSAPRGRRRLLAAGAGASGRSDISERIEEILANEVSSSH